MEMEPSPLTLGEQRPIPGTSLDVNGVSPQRSEDCVRCHSDAVAIHSQRLSWVRWAPQSAISHPVASEGLSRGEQNRTNCVPWARSAVRGGDGLCGSRLGCRTGGRPAANQARPDEAAGDPPRARSAPLHTFFDPKDLCQDTVIHAPNGLPETLARLKPPGRAKSSHVESLATPRGHCLAKGIFSSRSPCPRGPSAARAQAWL